MNRLITFAVVILFSTVGFSQSDGNKIYEKQGDLIAVTSYFEDGSIKEQGFYKDNKLHGEWNKFNKQGKKIVHAHYLNGKKTGVWRFIRKQMLS